MDSSPASSSRSARRRTAKPPRSSCARSSRTSRPAAWWPRPSRATRFRASPSLRPLRPASTQILLQGSGGVGCGIIKRMSAYALTAVALALTLLLTGCQDQPAVGAEEAKAKPAGPPPREVKVAPAAERTIARTVTATGTLAADDQVVLGTKVAGRLAEITVDLGTRVKKGQVIGKLDQSDFKFRVEQAEASLQQARVRLGLSPTGSDERVDPEQTAIVRQARAMMDD